MTTRTKANPLFVSAFFILGPILVIACFAWYLATGFIGVGLSDFIEALIHKDWDSEAFMILSEFRLPSAVALTLAGAGLAASAAILQGLMRNRLAAPTTFGLTEMSSLALFLAWPFILNEEVPTSIPIVTAALSIAGCLTSCIIMYVMTRLLKIPPSSMQFIFAGAFLGTAAHFTILLVRLYANDRYDLSATLTAVSGVYITGKSSYALASLIIVALVAAVGLSFFISKHFYGERPAGAVIYGLSAAVVILMAGLSVWLVGPVACIGLIASALLSKWCGNDYRIIIPGSAIIGAILLLLLSIISKSISPLSDIPIAHTSNAIAIPLFIIILWRHYRKTET
ncbi:ABC-type Fe3+-siderophore transport system, permease component [Paenibacillus algorifonticola]|uniref:ABC-type Fe3+-siderophore transport system, permease component n=1 Tax=Paenibacillus algorifonticola TaxID=684063 RepID=A0A1I2IPI4_9BACL|nr:iron chelate uptake ABC transporter family permease subunit [Paenibacillus algorifonticola]SFF44219.1 ABC-type Fe3+-siderophore transport system, permease component [Paenibacillus algorifonticola]